MVANHILDFQPQIDFFVLWLVSSNSKCNKYREHHLPSWWVRSRITLFSIDDSNPKFIEINGNPSLGINTFTVNALPSILFLMDNLIPMISNIWDFSAIPLACWCCRSWRTRETWRGRQIDRWWCRRRRISQKTCHKARTMDCRVGYELFLGRHYQGH